MSNVDYSLLKMNRKVRIEILGHSKIMLFRDFQKLVADHGCHLSKDNTLLIGPDKILEIRVDSLH